MRPYLRVANVFEERIDTSDIMEMNFTPTEYEVYRLKPNDILLNEGQSKELVGRPAIYRDEVPGACFTNTLVRFQASTGCDPEYALFVFRHYFWNGRFQEIATITTNIAHLGAGRFAEVEFPLPGIEEQVQIVLRANELLTSAEKQSEEIDRSLRFAETLRRSILSYAFSGNLVPQDPDDEPASELLARIRAESSAKSNITSKAGRPRVRPTTPANTHPNLFD